MNRKQIKGRVSAVKARLKETTGRLVGNETMQKRGAAERNAAEKKVLHEDLKEDLRRLA